MTVQVSARLLAVFVGMAISPAWAEEELCFIRGNGVVECFTIDGGTSGGGCGGNSQCGGNNRELPWVPDFLDDLELPKQKHDLMMEQFNSVQSR